MSGITKALTIFKGRQDLALIALLLITVLVMIVPLPTMLIDALIVMNISLTVAIMVVAVYLRRPEEFSAFPAIILIGTTFRLAISISTTRMILAQADAGKIVDTFGNFVTGGYVIIGLVIFLIITTVQFIVVTKGSERVAEVAARFTLDALPGRQMSIDAELRNGDIDQEEASRRRKQLEKQNQFFGAMDGAMKFVKGDAIAGLIIIVINLIGGIAIGMIEHGMTAGDAIQVYSRLTVGDGLVAQLPALIFAIAAGTVITRVTTDSSADLGTDIVSQLAGESKTLMVTGGVIAAIGFIPGFPTTMFLITGGAAGVGGWLMHKRKRDEATGKTANAKAALDDGRRTGAEAIAVRPTDVFRISAGQELYKAIDPLAFAEAREGALDLLFRQTGVNLPEYGIEERSDMPDRQVALTLDGIPVFTATVPAGLSVARCDADLLSINNLPVVAVDQVWPMKAAYWVDPQHARPLIEAGVPIIHVDQLLAETAAHFLRINASRIIGFETVQAVQKRYAESHHQVATQVAQTLSIVQLLNVFRILLAEGVPLMPRRILFEALLEASVINSDADYLAEAARAALARQICSRHADHNRVIAGFLLSPTIEDDVRQSIQVQQNGNVIMPAHLTEAILESCKRLVGREEIDATPPALVVARELRRPMARFLTQNRIELQVLSFQEIAREFVVNPVGMIGEVKREENREAA